MKIANLRVTDLSCEHAGSPLAVHSSQPFLSWRLESERRGAGQSAFRILAASSLDLLKRDNADLWDSGKVAQSAPHTNYGGKCPGSGKACFWKVMVWDPEDGLSTWSQNSSWEWGLLRPEDWSGEWIGAGEREAAPCFRFEFNLPKKVRRARAYFSGLGYGELWLNGERVGVGKFLPAWTNYDRREFNDMLYPHEDNSRRRVLYNVHDIGGLLAEGRNAVTCVLGNGMHNQRVRTIEGKMWYGPPRLLCELVFEFEDGSEARVGSGREWKWVEGPIVRNNLFVGETYDARKALPGGWMRSGFNDKHWNQALLAPVPEAALVGQMCPADEVVETLKPRHSFRLSRDRHILDFGKVFSGWLKLSVTGHRGSRVVLRFSEEIGLDGELDTRSCGADHVQQDEWILAGDGLETYEPTFVWHAFRYVEIFGWPEESVAEDAVLGIVAWMAIPPSGEFSCSHELLNELVRIFRNTQSANWHGGVISDCPHRERLGYTGDGQITAEAALWNFQADSFYKKWVEDIFDAQNQSSGFVPHTVPFYGGGGGYGWGAAAVIIPWQAYRFNTDVRILSENYDGMVLWMDYMIRHKDGRGILMTEEPGSWCLGDWSFPGKEPTVPPELVNTFYLGKCAEVMRDIAGVLDRKEDGKRFGDLLQKTRSDFHRVFFNEEEGCYAAGTGAADAFALELGAVPENEKNRVRQSLKTNGRKWDTGFLGTPVLLETLSAEGFGKEAFALLTETEFPSFGYMLAQGATSLWENWNRERGSHCHPMFGSICAWIYRHVAGLSQSESSAGFTELTWKPWSGPEVTEASLSYLSPRGPLRLSWSRKNSRWDLSLQLPPGSSLTLLLPIDSPCLLQIDGKTVVVETRTSWPEGLATMEETSTGLSLTLLSGAYYLETI